MGKNRTNHRAAAHLFVLLFLLGSTLPIDAQEAPLLVILPFDRVAVSAADADSVYTYLESSFAGTGVYKVITAEQRDQVLGSTQAGVCKDEECAVEIGRTLSAEQVVFGTVALSEGRFIVNARIVATANARTLAADSIGAAGTEELQEVCDILAIGMIRRAMPGSLPEPVVETEDAEDGTTDLQDGEETAQSDGDVSGGAVGPDGEGTEAVPQGSEGVTRADLWPLMNICGGIFLMELGNAAGSLGFELRRRKDATAGEDSAVNFGYYFTSSVSYVSWSAAVAAVPVYLNVFPDRAFQLSRRGRIVFTLGAALSVTGNILDLMAGAQRYRSDFLYDDYLSAGTGFDELYSKYRRAYILYSIERLTSYGLWVIGGGGMITAFFLSGPRENPISGFWDRAALVGGMTMVGLGSVTRTLALNARQTHVQSGGDETAYNRYVLNSVLSYTLWALGGTAFILPFVTDLGGGRRDQDAPEEDLTERRPENLQLLPMANGVVLRISY